MSGAEIGGDGVRLCPAGAGDLGDLTAVTTAGDRWVVTDPAGGRRLGGVGLHRGTVTVEVLPAERRRGVATAAVRALTDWAFTRGHTRLEMVTTWENAAAQRVAMAAAYQREGVRRGALDGVDGLPFARLSTDPAEPRPRLLPDLPGGELSDGVVTLRPLDAGDVAFYTELHAVQDVIDTSVPPVRPTAEEVRRRCASAAAQWLAGTRADLVIVDTETGTPTGGMGLYYMEPGTGQAMIGYSQLPAWRGRGYTTRAAQLLSLWVFAETDIARLIAGTNPDNTGSQRVLEKAGFRREAYLRSRLPAGPGKRIDDIQFVLLPSDVLARAAGAQG